MTEPQTPIQLGYRMPAEWAPHEATWLAWPHNRDTWQGVEFSEIQNVYYKMMEILLPYEKVHLLLRNEAEHDEVILGLNHRNIDASHLCPHIAETVDCWIRDYGPVFVKNHQGEKAWCKWSFNAWGNKYEDLIRDDQVFKSAPLLVQHPCFYPGMILEGGSIEVNGRGVCLVTEECLLNPNRNPGLGREAIEKKLRDYLGVNEIIWLARGLAGDDTDGHIDDIARFVDPETLVVCFETDENDENYPVLKENWNRLRVFSKENGKKWNLIELPMPGKVSGADGRRPASYANFYIANRAVLVPVFGHPNDDLAVRILQEHFPDRGVIAIPAAALVLGFGAIHCISQQEPA